MNKRDNNHRRSNNNRQQGDRSSASPRRSSSSSSRRGGGGGGRCWIMMPPSLSSTSSSEECPLEMDQPCESSETTPRLLRNYATFTSPSTTTTTPPTANGEAAAPGTTPTRRGQQQQRLARPTVSLPVWWSLLSHVISWFPPASHHHHQRQHHQHLRRKETATSSPTSTATPPSTPPAANTTTRATTRTTTPNHHHFRFNLDFLLKLVSGLILCVVVSVYRLTDKSSSSSRGGGRDHHLVVPDYDDDDTANAEWQWDHNVYNPRNQTNLVLPPTSSLQQERRNLLFAQVAGHPALNELALISSRPNRAYARQWGLDYVRYYSTTRQSLVRTCFDKAIVLHTILDKQFKSTAGAAAAGIPSVDPGDENTHHDKLVVEAASPSSSFSSSPSSVSWPVQPPPQPSYDLVLLLPPDAIIIDLDYDLTSMLPADKLVAIAGWEEDDHGRGDQDNGENPSSATDQRRMEATSSSSSSSSSSYFCSRTGVILFNARHPYAHAVAKLWYDLVQGPGMTCGAGNDISILLNAIRSTLANAGRGDETLSSLVAGLHETENGYVGNDADVDTIKGIAPTVPTSRAVMLVSKFTQTQETLQTTADSVCYRFYPKCEVL